MLTQMLLALAALQAVLPCCQSSLHPLHLLLASWPSLQPQDMSSHV